MGVRESRKGYMTTRRGFLIVGFSYPLCLELFGP